MELYPLRTFLTEKIILLPHFRAPVPLSIGYQTTRAGEPAIAAVRDEVLRVWQDARPVPTRPVPQLTLSPAKRIPRRANRRTSGSGLIGAGKSCGQRRLPTGARTRGLNDSVAAIGSRRSSEAVAGDSLGAAHSRVPNG